MRHDGTRISSGIPRFVEKGCVLVPRFISSRYQQDSSTQMSAMGDRAREFDDIINFSLGDPDLTTDISIIEAAAADAKAGHTHYTSSLGYPELRSAIAQMYAEDYSLPHRSENIMVTTSGCHAMWLVMETLLDDGDEVLIIEPYFTPYPSQVKLARGVPVFVPTRKENGFQVTTEDLEAAVTERTRAIIVNSPCNPTGVTWTRKALERVGEFATKHDLVVIADDIYTLFTYGVDFVPFASLPGMGERTITVSSFSKDYLMTGWRIGWIVGPSEFVNKARDVNENNVFTAPSISQRAGLAALQRRHEIQPAVKEIYAKRLAKAYNRVQALPNMDALRPTGTIYLWVDIRQTGLTSLECATRIVEEAHILTIPGTAFGASGEGFLRIAVTVGEETIDEAFDRLAQMSIFGGSDGGSDA